MSEQSLMQLARSGHDILLGGGQYQNRGNPEQTEFALSIVDLTARWHKLVALDFLAHGVALDPNDRSRVVVCEKIGPGAALVDLESQSVVRKIPTSDDRLYYGHCAYSTDGTLLYTTETYKTSSEGAIVIRDARSLDIVGEFPSFGSSPHECLLIDGGKTMVVTNGGGDERGPVPNVAYIDVASRKLVRQEQLTNRALNTGHLAIAADGGLVVVSAPRVGAREPKLGGISIQPAGKKMRSLSSPKKVVGRMLGEALSVFIHDDKAAVTHPDGGMVTFWTINDRHFVKQLPMPKPRGVTMTRDRSRFVVSFGPEANIVQIRADDLEPIEASLYPRSFVTGSHLYNWSELALAS